MPRRPLAPGEWGNLHFSRRPDGRMLAQARFREQSGCLRRFRIIGQDEYECVRRLERESGSRIATTRVVPADRPDLLTETSLLAELLDCWLEVELHAGEMTPAAVERAAAHIRNHIDSALGRSPIGDLRVQSIDRFLRSQRRTSGDNVAARSRSVLLRALRLAVAYDVLLSNAAEKSIPIVRPQKEPTALTLRDVGSLRREVSRWVQQAPAERAQARQRLQDLVEVALGSGLRLGELLALSVDAVDLAAGSIRVEATWARVASEGLRVVQSPKRKRQVRVLHLPEFAVAALKRRVSALPASAVTIFAGRDGAAWHPNSARAELARFLQGADAWMQPLEELDHRHVTFQLLRRTVATELARRGGVELAREQLGHARLATTERAYLARSRMVDERVGDMLEVLFAPTAAEA